MKFEYDHNIKVTDATEEFLTWLKEELIVVNPEYEKKKRMGLPLYNVPRKIHLYKKIGSVYILPIGASKFLYKKFRCETHVNLQKLHKQEHINYSMNLYDYQEEAVNAMEKAVLGILQSPAGSGKTTVGIALALKLGYRTLWLTHTQDLLKQSLDRAAQFFPRERIGTITAGKVDIGDFFTFATVQTMANMDLSEYKNYWNVIITDEMHRAAGSPTQVTQFYKILNSLSARHKYGLSATVHRADGMIKASKLLFGDIAHIVEKGNTMIPDVKIVQTDFVINKRKVCKADGTIVYAKLLKEICEDDERNKIIVENLKSCKDNFNLILSDRVGHLKDLKDMLGFENSAYVDGKTKKDEREKIFADARNGKINYLFASFKLAKEGLDIPCLDRLHLATPQSDYAIVTQSVGRICRVVEGKGVPVVLDYVDINVKSLANKLNARKRHYRKLDIEI